MYIDEDACSSWIRQRCGKTRTFGDTMNRRRSMPVAYRWGQPSSLDKTVEVKATNRPVKIAYLVPFNDTPHTHMNLDAVFFESYTPLGWTYTLVIPTESQEVQESLVFQAQLTYHQS